MRIALLKSGRACAPLRLGAAMACAVLAMSARSAPPGVVIDHSPAASGLYIGSPSLAVLPNGHYVASHDFFGPQSGEHKRAQTAVFSSADRGATWQKIGQIDGQFWSTLFVHRGDLYILGTDKHHGDAIIRRSRDQGRTWTIPADASRGLLSGGGFRSGEPLRGGGEYHCAPVPVIEHAGRLWRGMEWRQPPEKWGVNYRAGMLSIPLTADLLNATNWVFSNALASDPKWLNGTFGAWLEGNAVVTRGGLVVDVLRVDTPGYPEKAALVQMSEDGRVASFDPASGFIDFPGGAKKFTIRFDPRSDTYWSIATLAAPEYQSPARKPARVRNTLALTASKDLCAWEIRRILLQHADVEKHGFQYVDWLFEGEDIIAACRTAFEDEWGGAHNNHDANYLTFHRFEGFRSSSPREKE